MTESVKMIINQLVTVSQGRGPKGFRALNYLKLKCKGKGENKI